MYIGLTVIIMLLYGYGGIGDEIEEYIEEEECKGGALDNPIDLCFEDYNNHREIKSVGEMCPGYDPNNLEASGYISEDTPLYLCVGWATAYFPPQLSFCNKEKLKNKITFRRIPYYKDKRFSIKDRYEISPKGLMIQHEIRPGLFVDGVIFLKEGYKIEDLPYWKKKKIDYPYLPDKIDLSKPSYIEVKNKFETESLRKKCADVIVDYAYKFCDNPYFIGLIQPFFDYDEDKCQMIPIINDIYEHRRESIWCGICSYSNWGQDREKEIKVWRYEFNKDKEKTKGYKIGKPQGLSFCITGEYEFEIKYVKWYK